MNAQIRIAMAAVAVVVLAVIGINVLPKTPGGGGPAVPTAIPTPAPTLPAAAIPPGTYRAGFVTYTLPAGWVAFSQETILKGNAEPPNGMAVDLWQIAAVFPDPCQWQSKPAPALGNPTVAQLVAAFVAQKRGTVVTPVNVIVDGYAGKEIDLTVPLGTNVAACEGGQYTSWLDPSGGQRYNQGPGQHDLLDILDVNGQTRVIQRSFYPANTAADRAELQAIVDSIKITP